MKRVYIACLLITLLVKIADAQLNSINVDNQPQVPSLTNRDFTQKFSDDTLPNRLIAAINKQYALNKNILRDYIIHHKPSQGFIKTAQLNLAYFAPRLYCEIKENNCFGRKGSAATLQKWQKIQDSLFATVKLNNDDALTSFNYTTFISEFLQYEENRIFFERDQSPRLFYREWYQSNVVEGKKLFDAKGKNLFKERILNKYFFGKAAEYLYSDLLRIDIARSESQNIDLIFAHFKQKYPESKYISVLNGPINEIAKKQNQPLNDKMIFVANNGSNLNTIKDVLAVTKGKTVFVDMWGTWCSSCRVEIEKNSAALRNALKGKGVDFLYVANYDMKNEREWKKLIAYYKMEGTHILANDNLNRDIMSKVKSSGYPTYFIIKKDGSYHIAKTHSTDNTQAMVKELESAAM
jgi:thiol-disulfide isomerase/thioredoxin